MEKRLTPRSRNKDESNNRNGKKQDEVRNDEDLEGVRNRTLSKESSVRKRKDEKCNEMN